ncbi:SDR family NAD(P)-dependent oxidoreductase [Clostridium cylindrosporum]|uniref:Oxidoreductase, short chain dehydrogenase/reductase family n=1 Tax=Clostridium cylindrosporum DSM 605 TaxID=1121307 RepID=A0A0J8G6H7_CLOCY|nr:SDR family oxidoreductase [Clostridium cylindrosporum]KMT23211.1 oxidoreductase, short chain dehydrogenase/reductase family [Clostridium cylindrosporum DSM 605]
MDKVAVITGATSGIGKEFSRRLAEKGYNLIIVGRRDKLLNQVSIDIEKEFNVKVEVKVLDLSNKKELDSFIEFLKEKDNIEFLVNNAGHGAADTFTRDKYENQEEMINVHILASVKLCHVISQGMKKRKKGYIINVSSIASFNSFPTSGMYCATKGFLTSFSQSLALELADYNIKVQALCPGFTRTDFHEKLKMDEDKLKNKGVVRWMTPKEVVSTSLGKIEKQLKVIVIPGFGNKIMCVASRFTPKFIYYKIAVKGWKLLD